MINYVLPFIWKPSTLENIGKGFHLICISTKMNFYAVARGRNVGIFDSWTSCEAQVRKFSGALFKKFKSKDLAERYLRDNGISTSTNSTDNNTLSPVAIHDNNELLRIPKDDNKLKKKQLKFHKINATLKDKIKQIGSNTFNNNPKPASSTMIDYVHDVQSPEKIVNANLESVTNCYDEYITKHESKLGLEDDCAFAYSDHDDCDKKLNQKDASKSIFNHTTINKNSVDFFQDDDDEFLLNAAKNIEEQNTFTPPPTLKRKSTNLKGRHTKIPRYESIVYKPVGIQKFNNYEFPVDSDGYVIVYTDGACENNGKKNAAAGLGVYFNDNHPLNISKPVEGRATNNCGELQAAIYALSVAKDIGINKIIINTDSQFLINSVTNWIWEWSRKEWKLKSGGAVKNIVEFKKLYFFLRDNNIRIKWNYTKGHDGIKGNEEADALAKRGAEAYKNLHMN